MKRFLVSLFLLTLVVFAPSYLFSATTYSFLTSTGGNGGSKGGNTYGGSGGGGMGYNNGHGGNGGTNSFSGGTVSFGGSGGGGSGNNGTGGDGGTSSKIPATTPNPNAGGGGGGYGDNTIAGVNGGDAFDTTKGLGGAGAGGGSGGDGGDGAAVNGQAGTNGGGGGGLGQQISTTISGNGGDGVNGGGGGGGTSFNIQSNISGGNGDFGCGGGGHGGVFITGTPTPGLGGFGAGNGGLGTVPISGSAGGGGLGAGGAIFVTKGDSQLLSDCIFDNCRSIGGDGGTAAAFPAGNGTGQGGSGLGGAIFLQAEEAGSTNGATITIDTRITFSNNDVVAGSGHGFAANGLARGKDIYMMSGSNIIVQNLTSNSSVPNPIESNFDQAGINGSLGGLTLDTNNTAIFSLNGANTYTGTTTINSGSLYVNGSLITPVTLNGGTFGGNNTTLLSNVTVPNSGQLLVNGGMVAPGGNNLFGDLFVETLTFTGGGMFDAEVDSLANTDAIHVTGTATLTGTLEVAAASGNFLEGEVITLIEAGGGITGQFTTEILPTLPGGSPLFSVDYSDPNKVNLVVLEDLVFATQPISSRNPQAVVNYILSQLPIDPTSDFGFIVESLGLVPDDQINKALNLMHPGSFGLFEWMNISNNAEVMQMINGRMFGRSNDSSPAMISALEPTLTAATEDQPFYPRTPVRRGCGRDQDRRHAVWLEPFGTWNSQSSKGELRGAHYESAGVLGGYDYTFDNWYVGGALGYAYTNFRWEGRAGHGHINQVFGGLYGSYFMKYFAATLSTMVGGNYYDTDRSIRWTTPNHPGGGVNRTAHSDYSGIQWINHLGLIGDFNPFSVPLQIFANLDHFYLHNDSFSESGAKSINLRVNGKTSNALRSELGLSSSYTFHVASGCWTPYIRMSWVNKTLLSSSTYRGSFRGQVGTFSVSATSQGTNQWAPGVGVEFANTHGLSVLFNSRAELNGKMQNYSADMRMEYAF